MDAVSLVHPIKNTYQDDKQLWSSCKAGDQEALARLYKKHYSQLYKYGVFTSKDPDLVMDCLQELFSWLWSKRERVSQVDCVKIYLFKSYHRLLVNQLIRSKKLMTSIRSKISSGIMPPFEETLIEVESRSEQAHRLQECIQSLSKGQREVIFLKFFNDLSYTEISEIMEMRVDSVYNLASRAIELLRKKIQPQNILVRAA